MEDTLRALGEILLKAVPTFLLVLLLHFYLKKMFFQPLEKKLHERYEATEGARKLAEQSLARATARTDEYEAALRSARTEVYQAQEALYRQLQESEQAQLAVARQHSEANIRAAKDLIAVEVEEAKQGLAREADRLANEISDSILRGSAA